MILLQNLRVTISDDDGFEILSKSGCWDHGVRGKTEKSVRFDVTNNLYHESNRTLSAKERNECWYSGLSISTFKKEIVRDAERMFMIKGLKKLLPSKLSPGKSKWATVLRAYKDCADVRTEDEATNSDFVAVDRRSMSGLYTGSAQVLGLERVLFQSLRGQSSATVALLLNLAREKTRTIQDRDSQDRIYRRVSQNISRPCRVLARELAVAQAASL